MKKYSSWIMLLILVCLWGGIYDFTVAIYGICFAIGLFVLLQSEGRIQIKRNRSAYAMLLIVAGFIISTLAARDKGMALIGLLRMLVFSMFWIFWSNLKPEKRESFWCRLTDVVAVVTAGALFCYFIPVAKEYLFRAGRLGGVLQYSNTYAMLLLLCVIALFYQRKRTWKWLPYVEAGMFTVGILWSGSRSVFVLYAVAVLILLIRKRNQISWKWLLPLVICIVGAACILTLVLHFDISRLLKLTMSSSTLNGRFLYWRDALIQLGHHPAGLGYMGYYYLQPQFQTGNYVVRYVHNDILQFGLDGGWLALAGIAVLFAGNIFNKKNTEQHRLMLVFLLLHVLFDFDLQYGLLFCILLMCADTEGAKVWGLKKQAGCGIALAGLAVSAYFSLALGSSYAGNQEMATAMYPGNTSAWEEQMRETQDAQAAEKIIQKNGMRASAYETRAMAEISDGNYKEACEDIRAMLNCAGYQSYYYNQAVYELSYCLQGAVESDDMEFTQQVLEQIQGIPDQIQRQEQKATRFAKRINDKPEIELEDSIRQYLSQLSDVNLNE